MANLCPGYIGVAEVNDRIIRCSDFGVNPNQEFQFYDHVIGLNDTVPLDRTTKGELVGQIQTQKRIGRPSPISIGGGFSFPAAEKGGSSVNFKDLFNHAKYGTYFTLAFQFHRGQGQESRTFSNCRVNQFSFSATSGDTLNISVDIFAKGYEDLGNVSSYKTPEKLITWDKIKINTSGLNVSSGIQGFEFSINNNLKNVYTNIPDATNHFFPNDIRVGMQEVTGSVSIYNIPGISTISSLTEENPIKIDVIDFDETMSVIYKPQQVGGTLGPIITSIPFVGVDKAFGD